MELSKAPAVLTVKLRSASTLYVLQDGKLRFLFKWPFEDKEVKVPVPFGNLSPYPLGGGDADPSGPDHSLFITVTDDLSLGDPGPAGIHPLCVTCASGLQERYAEKPEYVKLVNRFVTQNWCCPVKQ